MKGKWNDLDLEIIDRSMQMIGLQRCDKTSSKIVTLDSYSWECLTEEMDREQFKIHFPQPYRFILTGCHATQIYDLLEDHKLELTIRIRQDLIKHESWKKKRRKIIISVSPDAFTSIRDFAIDKK